ncbi:MAG TPA: nicotinate-nucleotide adenylyltransferase [Solirubrobacteraceae bacterium]|nr:nicotinate-nucleotide adenylyltransferase [Solirubrobacteraceae bacterium]
MTAVGILGGTFNPPHLAHMVCASEARAQLGLDRVMLIPAGVPPHKPVENEPGAEHRLEMCRLAIGPHTSWLSASAIEIERDGPSFTVDTLRQIHAGAPGDELTFIVGGDMAWSLPSWREPEAILELASLAVAERAGARREEVRARLGGMIGAQRIKYIDVPRLDISSSALRSRIKEGRTIDYLVADDVAEYIEQRRLYQ